MIIVPFRVEHAQRLQLQPGQAHIVVNPDVMLPLEGELSFAALDEQRVLAVAGITEIWQGRAQCWAMLAGGLGRHFVQIHRAVQRALDMSDYRRIETYVDSGFAEGHRWIKMLGFTHEGRARAYSPEGRDCDLYARVRHG